MSLVLMVAFSLHTVLFLLACLAIFLLKARHDLEQELELG